jgi:hypothetical protein
MRLGCHHRRNRCHHAVSRLRPNLETQMTAGGPLISER